MTDIYAAVTLANGLVTDTSTVTVEGLTVPLKRRSDRGWALAPARIVETLDEMGYRTRQILTGGSTVVRVLVERNTQS